MLEEGSEDASDNNNDVDVIGPHSDPHHHPADQDDEVHGSQIGLNLA